MVEMYQGGGVIHKPVGDAAMARKVIRKVEGWETAYFYPEEFGMDDDQRFALREVLGSDSCPKPEDLCPGLVTPQEETFLRNMGFAKEFVETLAGPDGRRALEARAKWFREEACFDGGPDLGSFLARTLRVDKEDKKERECARRALGQLLHLSPKIPATGIPLLRQVYRHFSDDEGMVRKVIQLLDRLETPTDEALLFLEEIIENQIENPARYVWNEATELLARFGTHAIPSLFYLIERQKLSFLREESILKTIGAKNPEWFGEVLIALYYEGGERVRHLVLLLLDDFFVDPDQLPSLLMDAMEREMGDVNIRETVFRVLHDRFS